MTVWSGVIRDIVRRPWYYWNSAWIRTYRIASRRGLFDRAVFGKTKASLRSYDAIVFVLDDPMMHIGDQLFFLPLIFKLAGQGYPVAVSVSNALSFLFPRELLTRRHSGQSLFVSRLPVLPHLRRTIGPAVDFFMIDGLSPTIAEATGLFALRTFCRHFRLTDVSPELSNDEIAELARPVALSPSLASLAGRPLVVLANYMDSGQHLRSAATMDRMLNDLAQFKKNHGGTVVHLGTASDRDSDPKDYSALIDVDLRGRTSLVDLFSMFRNLDIGRVFTCDTAVLHAARMYARPVQIYWRSRKTKERYVQIMRAHIHFFDDSVFERDGADAIATGWPS